MKRFAYMLLLTLVAVGCKSTPDTSDNEEANLAEESVDESSGEESDQDSDSGAFAGCEVTQFTSGWIDISCDDARFLIQPDRAAMATIDQTWNAMSKSLSEEYEAGVYGEETQLKIGGDEVPARTFTVSARGDGKPMAVGVYALWSMGETAKMAGACIQEPEDESRERCVAGFRALQSVGIPGGAEVTESVESGAPVMLASESVELGDDCQVAGERKVTCEAGELTWFQGDREEAKAKAQKALEDMRTVASAGGGSVDESKRPCMIGEYETTCRAYDIKSDAQHAKYHTAIVDVDGESLAIACWYDAVQAMPSACQAIFGIDASTE